MPPSPTVPSKKPERREKPSNLRNSKEKKPTAKKAGSCEIDSRIQLTLQLVSALELSKMVPRSDKREQILSDNFGDTWVFKRLSTDLSHTTGEDEIQLAQVLAQLQGHLLESKSTNLSGDAALMAYLRAPYR